MFSLAYLFAYAYVLVKTSLDWAHGRRPRANVAEAIEEIVTQVTDTFQKKKKTIMRHPLKLISLLQGYVQFNKKGERKNKIWIEQMQGGKQLYFMCWFYSPCLFFGGKTDNQSRVRFYLAARVLLKSA